MLHHFSPLNKATHAYRWLFFLIIMLALIFWRQGVPTAKAATCTWNGLGADNNWSTTGNWDCGMAPTLADDVVFDGTSAKNATVDGAVTINSLTVSGYGGVISLGAQSLTTNAGFAIDNGASFNAGTGTVQFTGSQTVDSAAGLYSVTVAAGSGTITLNQNLVVNNTLTIATVGAFTSSGGSWDFQVSGDVTSNDIAFTSANTRVSLVGNTDQQLLGGGELVNLDVSKTGGNVVLPANFVLVAGTLTGSGLIQNGGGSLVIGDGGSGYTLDFGGTIDDMVVNIANGSFVFLNQHLVVNNSMTITAVGAFSSSGGSWDFQVSGDVTSNDVSFTSANTRVSLVGNTDQQLLGGGELVNLDVSKTGGNVVLPANFVLDNGTLTGSGLIQNGGGSLVIGDGDSSYTLDFGGTIDDMVVNIGNGSFVFLNQHLVVNNNMTIISVGAINGSGSIRELQVSGDVIINDNGFTQSLSTIAMISGGLQNLTANVATSFGNLTVGAGTIAVETVSADNLSITTVTNNGIIRKSQTAAVGALDFGLTNVAMNVDSETGSPSITVDRIDSDHPNAAPGMVSSSDMYWDITATAGTFQVDITFNDPTVSTVSGDQRSCRTDDGGTNWDCQLDDDGDGTNSQVVRNDVTAFSAWQSCAGCGPTAISLSSTSLNVGNSWNQQLLLSFTALVLLSGLALFWFGRRRQLQ